MTANERNGGRDRGEFHPSRKGVEKNMLLKSGKHDAIGGERGNNYRGYDTKGQLRRMRYYCTCTHIYIYICMHRICLSSIFFLSFYSSRRVGVLQASKQYFNLTK